MNPLRRITLAALATSVLACGGTASTVDEGSTTSGATAAESTGSGGGTNAMTQTGVGTSAGETSSAETSTDETSTSTGSGATASDPDGPQIVSLQTNPPSIDNASTLVVSAVVTDPDGIVDIVGGTLTTEDGMLTYGTFAPADTDGAYELTLTWEALDAVVPIEFGGEYTLVLRAEFVDQAGHTAWDTVGVGFDCIAACDVGCERGECHPSAVGSCPGGSRCLHTGTQWECFEVTSNAGALEPCASIFDCTEDFYCTDLSAAAQCTGASCCSPLCESDADCPDGTDCQELVNPFLCPIGFSICQNL